MRSDNGSIAKVLSRFGFAICLAFIGSSQVEGGGRAQSNIDAKLSLISMTANRVFLTLLVGEPFTGHVTIPHCTKSAFFLSHIEEAAPDKFRLSDAAFASRGYHPETARRGRTAAWPGRCLPVEISMTTDPKTKKSHIVLEWPNFVDAEAVRGDVIRLLMGDRELFDTYRLTQDRMREIYVVRFGGEPNLPHPAAVWDASFPSLEIHFDRHAVERFDVREWLDLSTAGATVSEDRRWIRLRIDLRSPG